jgi:hypothetical protein
MYNAQSGYECGTSPQPRHRIAEPFEAREVLTWRQ